jgi:hypothetical protein
MPRQVRPQLLYRDPTRGQPFYLNSDPGRDALRPLQPVVNMLLPFAHGSSQGGLPSHQPNSQCQWFCIHGLNDTSLLVQNQLVFLSGDTKKILYP